MILISYAECPALKVVSRGRETLRISKLASEASNLVILDSIFISFGATDKQVKCASSLHGELEFPQSDVPFRCFLSPGCHHSAPSYPEQPILFLIPKFTFPLCSSSGFCSEWTIMGSNRLNVWMKSRENRRQLPRYPLPCLRPLCPDGLATTQKAWTKPWSQASGADI